jgi:hypothetical protein
MIAGQADIPGPDEVGYEKALNGYAAWFNMTFLPGGKFLMYGVGDDADLDSLRQLWILD